MFVRDIETKFPNFEVILHKHKKTHPDKKNTPCEKVVNCSIIMFNTTQVFIMCVPEKILNCLLSGFSAKECIDRGWNSSYKCFEV